MSCANRLYTICVDTIVSDCLDLFKHNKHDFRLLPNRVLFDLYYKLFLGKRLCLLAVEFTELQVFMRMLTVKNQRVKLLKMFQSLLDHGSHLLQDMFQNYVKMTQTVKEEAQQVIDVGLKIGGFLKEGGWMDWSIKMLNTTEEFCKKQQQSVAVLTQLLDCYYKRIYAESWYCEFEAAQSTFESAQEVIKLLEDQNSLPNLSGLYANFCIYFYSKSDYNDALFWGEKALKNLNVNVPIRVKIDVLRLASKTFVVRRRFKEAGLLVRQAVNLAAALHSADGHPQYSDALMDYGFFLLYFDSIQQSVKMYQQALDIRKEVFDENNVLVAKALEDLAYALYVNEYITGRFYYASEIADRAIRIMERIIPKPHLRFASIKRVKALILEEMALSDPQIHDQYLQEAEELHKFALDLSYKSFGAKSAQTAKHYGNLGRLYQSMKQYEKAEQMHLKAIAIKEEFLGKDDYEVGLSIGHLASLYNYHMLRYDDALKLYKRSIEISLNLFGEAYSGLEYDYRGLINVYEETGNSIGKAYYQQKMQTWICLRNQLKPEELSDEVLPLDELLKQFFEMCQ